MENTISAKFPSFVLVFVICFLTLSVFSTVNGQTKATLENTEWDTDQIVINGYGLQSVFRFRFLKNGMASCTGVLAMPTRYDPMTRQFIFGFKQEEQFTGNYSQSGSSINFNCKDYKVTAKLSSNRIIGKINMEGTDYDLTAFQIAGNTVRIANSDKTIGRNNGAVDLSSLDKKNNGTSKSSTQLKIGTYKIVARQTLFMNGIPPYTEDVAFAIKVESVSANGVVKGRIYMSGGEGLLKGQVDSRGGLFLEGSFTVQTIVSPYDISN